MKAYILAAGKGSRLLPLTEKLPKPMVPLMNRPLVSYLLHHLRPHITHARLNVSYNKQPLIEYLGQQAQVSHFDEGDCPLGSAATLYEEREYCREEVTLVACGDLLSNWDVEGMVRFHRQSQALVTVVTREVPNPRSFGVVVSDSTGRVVHFEEKPAVPLSHQISCGIYLFSPAVFDYWDCAWKDIGSHLLPELVEQGLPVYAWKMDASTYWNDIGTPVSYLETHLLRLRGANAIDRTARVDPTARLGETVVGPGAVVHAHARLDRCVIWPGSIVWPGQMLCQAIVTPDHLVEARPACLSAG